LALQVLQNWWLSVWAHQTQAAGDHLSSDGLHFYLGVYSLIGMAALSSQAVRGVFLLFGMLNASRVLHADLVSNVSAVSGLYDSPPPTKPHFLLSTRDCDARLQSSCPQSSARP